MRGKNNYISSLLSNNGYIAVNRVLIKKLGLNCAVLIGELCSEYNYYSENNQFTDKEWFYSTVPNIEENTGLNRYYQEETIKMLKKYNIIETKVMGMPSKRYFKINFTEIEKIFKNNDKNTKKGQKMAKNKGSKPVTTKEVKELQPRKQESAHQGSKPVTTKEVKELPPRKQTSRQHGGKPVATNNNNNNNKLININNNLILSTKDEIRKNKNKIWNNYKVSKKNVEMFYKNININNLKKYYADKPISNNMFKEIISLCENVLLKNQEYYNLSGSKISLNNFIDRILKLSEDHIKYIVESLSKSTKKIKNIKAYMLACIYNSTDTIETYYKNLINYDMANSTKEKDMFIA